MGEYEKQAEAFLAKFSMKLRATFKGDRCPDWGCDKGCHHGDRYRVTISRKGGGRISFNFWNSQKDMQENKAPTAYDVLACISSDVYCPDTLEEFCSEYGYELDSRKTDATFRRCNRFAERLLAFFTTEEQEALSEIR